MLSLYMQQVLGYSAMQTGVGYLAVALTAVAAAGASQALVTKVGVKPVLIVGMVLLGLGLAFFSQVSVGGSYVADLLPGFLLICVGMGFSFVPISIAALAGITSTEAGLASGLINTSQQIGGALGIAALSAIATSTTTSDLSSGTSPAFALTNGFQDAFIAGAIIAFVGVLVSVFVVSRRDLTEEVPEAEPAFEQAA